MGTPQIVECAVISPATTGEIRTRVAEALGAGHGILSLILRPSEMVPPPEDVPVALHILRPAHLTEHIGRSISGLQVEIIEQENGEEPLIHELPSAVSVHLAAEPEQPSTASIVAADWPPQRTA